MLLAHLLRDALLARSLPAAAPSPSAALRQRLYLKAISLVPPSASALRSAAERQALSDEALLSDPQPSPEVTFLTRRAYQELAEALANMCPLREQEVILFTLEGQDDKTIAEALETSENNIRVTRHRALTRLRKALAEPDPGGGDGR